MSDPVRFHLSLNVSDLATSVAFFRTLLGVEPAGGHHRPVPGVARGLEAAVQQHARSARARGAANAFAVDVIATTAVLPSSSSSSSSSTGSGIRTRNAS